MIFSQEFIKGLEENFLYLIFIKDSPLQNISIESRGGRRYSLCTHVLQDIFYLFSISKQKFKLNV